MDGDPALYDDALTYPFRGDRTVRRFVVGLSPFAVMWFLIMVAHALLLGSRRHPEHPGIPLEAAESLVYLLFVFVFLSPCHALLLGYYARVVDETIAGSRGVAGYGEPLAMGLQAGRAAVSFGVLLPLGAALAFCSVAVASLAFGRSPTAVPQPITLSILALVGFGIAHAGAAQLVVLLGDHRGVRALGNVGRTLSVVTTRGMLVASISAAGLFLVGGVFGYALYVLAFGLLYGGLGLVAGSVGWSMILVLGGASLALGSGVYYMTLCAVRLFALIAREAVAAAPVPAESS